MLTTPTIAARDLPALRNAPADRRANRGRALEEFLTALFDGYRARGIAFLWKVPTAWRPIRGADGEIETAIVTASATVDFVGVAHGRAVAIEAKSAADRIRWDAVTDVQAAALNDYERSGGVGYVAVELGGDHYLVPWREWPRTVGWKNERDTHPQSISRVRARTEWACYVLDTRDAFAALRPARAREEA